MNLNVPAIMYLTYIQFPFKRDEDIPPLFFSLPLLIPLIIIRLLNSLEYDFPVFCIGSEMLRYYCSSFEIIDRTSLHGSEIDMLVYVLPIDNFMKSFFQYHIKPYSHASSISLQERMSNIHLYIFRNDLLKCLLLHVLYLLKNIFEI